MTEALVTIALKKNLVFVVVCLFLLCTTRSNLSTICILSDHLGFEVGWGLTSIWKMLFLSSHIWNNNLHRHTKLVKFLRSKLHIWIKNLDKKKVTRNKREQGHSFFVTRLLRASVKHYCIFDLSRCSVKTTSFRERFWDLMRAEQDGETDGKRGIIMSRDINFFGCLWDAD